VRAVIDDNFAKIRTDAGEFREVRIVTRAEKRNRGE
jgi:hypothetical protein